MQRLGQHFLKNKTVLRKIAKEILDASAEEIIEIGAGHGELTECLAEGAAIASRKIHIVAVEKDPPLVKILEEKFRDASAVEVVPGDIRIALPPLASRASRYSLVGNIPYYLTGYLFRLIEELENKPTVSVFLIQKEVAERLSAGAPRMNRLAAAVQFWADPKMIMSVSRREFSPIPDVDSAVIKLTTKPKRTRKDAERYFSLVRIMFAQPRKTVLNNMSAGIKEVPRLDIEKKLLSLGVKPGNRPQDISVDNIVELARAFKK